MDSSQNIDGFENPLSEFEGFGRTRRTRTDEATDCIKPYSKPGHFILKDNLNLF